MTLEAVFLQKFSEDSHKFLFDVVVHSLQHDGQSLFTNLSFDGEKTVLIDYNHVPFLGVRKRAKV
jgi:hypothetical protein